MNPEAHSMGCPIYSHLHFETPISNGQCDLQTKAGILPSLKGKYLVLPLYALTRAQIYDSEDKEDRGMAAAEQQQQNINRRIARRIPQLIQAFLLNPNDHLMKIYGFVGGYDKKKAVELITDDSNMLEVTHVIYENCQYDLKQYVEKTGIPNNETALTLAYQLILAVEHLHGPVGVMHRRLNPETIYISGEKDENLVLKVGNILFARKTTYLHVTAERNVPMAYAAPETVTSLGRQIVKYGLPADIWSYGMVLYFITHGQDPFGREIAGRGGVKLREHLLKEKLRPVLDDKVDDLLKDIMRNCWKEDPDARRTASQIKELLERRSNPNS